jgi:hypothetical protein
VSDELRDNVEAGTQAFGARFYSRPARDCIAKKKPLPNDPYEYKWPTTSVRKMVDEIGEAEMYGFYSHFSNGHTRARAEWFNRSSELVLKLVIGKLILSLPSERSSLVSLPFTDLLRATKITSLEARRQN